MGCLQGDLHCLKVHSVGWMRWVYTIQGVPLLVDGFIVAEEIGSGRFE